MTTTITVSNDVLLQLLGDEAMLLDMRTERYFGLNRVGMRIWTMLSDGIGIDEMQTRLLAEFDVAPDTLSTDIDTLLAQLEERGLVSRGSSG